MEAFIEFLNSISYVAFQYNSNNKWLVLKANKSRDASCKGKSLSKYNITKFLEVIRIIDRIKFKNV